MCFSLIVAMDANGLIGSDNQLPWSLPADLKFVRNTTMGMTVVMGRKNFESIGKALPGRQNVILTRDKTFSSPDCEIYHSVEDIIDAFDEKGDEIFIFGGSEVYRQFLPHVSAMFITRIHHHFEGDVYFPEIDWSEWEETSSIKGTVDDKNIYPHTFHMYERKSGLVYSTD